MSIWDALTGQYAKAVATAEAMPAHLQAANAATMPMVVGPASPFHESDTLQSIVWADLLGAEVRTVTRAAAMGAPAVARHRHLLCGTGARCPLVRLDGAGTRLPTPAWATRTDGELSPYHRMLWTLDDLVFHGWSVWSVTRAGNDELESGTRIAPARWEADPQGRVKIDGEPVKAKDMVLIPGPHEGILSFGASALRRTLDNLDAAAKAARNPSAYLELHYTGDAPQSPEAKAELLDGWVKARRGESGGVAYTNKWVEVKEHGTHEAHLLIEGRNADAVDVARMMSNPASMADASSGDSLTYENKEGRQGQLLDYGVSLYLDAVAARLSMDDVVPAGEHMAFDTSAVRAITEPATGPTLED